MSTPFVVWTTSGLENALLALLCAVLCSLCLRAAETDASGRLDLGAGLIGGLAALTRPDAIVYACAYPAAVIARNGWRRPGALPPVLGRYAAGLVPPLLAWQAVRLAWFGDLLPNTYYAKGGPALAEAAEPGKLRDVLASTGGPAAGLLVLALVAGLLAAVRLGRGRRAAVLLLHLVLALSAYLLLPLDWMSEYRFATPFFMFFSWVLAEALDALGRSSSRGRPVSAALAAAAILLTAVVHLPRSAAFARDPTVPFPAIAALGGQGFNRLADLIQARDGSVLLPDVGGALFASRLRVYDLAGLCDRVTARTMGSDPTGLRDYVFERVRPTFIHVHGVWAERAALHSDLRFRRDYAVLREAWRPSPDALESQPEPWAGDYVRRDALREVVDLVALRRAFREAGMDELGPWPRPRLEGPADRQAAVESAP